MRKLELRVRQMCLPSIILNDTNNKNGTLKNSWANKFSETTIKM